MISTETERCKGLNAVIVYRSKTGLTQQYAEWIQEATHFDIMKLEDASETSFAEYELVVFGSRIHAGRIDGLKKMKGLLPDMHRIQLVVFATGGTPYEAEDAIAAIWRASFSEEELHAIPHFYMPAGLNYEKMSVGDKLIMKTLTKILRNKNDKNAVESGCEQAIGQSYNVSSKSYMTPLLEFIESRQ